MNETGTPTRQHRQMAAMVALEGAICERAEFFESWTSHNPEVASVIGDLPALADRHRQALIERLRAIAPAGEVVEVPDPPPFTPAMEALSDAEKYPDSTALVALHGLLDQAVVGYSVLLELCLRAADSAVRGPDNSADPVFAHLKDYTRKVRGILQALPYVIVGELEQEGQECQCICPSCGLGVCLCGVATRRNYDLATQEAGPIYTGGPIVMVKPRTGSAAHAAGLQKGDLLAAVDGKEIDTIVTLQQSVRAHSSGEAVSFAVRRDSGEASTVVLVRP